MHVWISAVTAVPGAREAFEIGPVAASGDDAGVSDARRFAVIELRRWRWVPARGGRAREPNTGPKRQTACWTRVAPLCALKQRTFIVFVRHSHATVLFFGPCLQHI